MAISSKYIPIGSLQDYFVDKTTGLPLSAGIVTFYRDADRSTLKPVYELTGSPPDYNTPFTELPNPMNLSSVGTFADESGNDIIPYALPYLDEASDVVDLYYITVQSAGHINQFTRQAFPYISSSSGPSNSVTQNYITNGQALVHYDIQPNSIVSEDVTVLGPGGWTYERSTGSSAIDEITFPEVAPIDGNPSSYPRFSIRVQCTNPEPGNTLKTLCIKFPDVNKFASETDNKQFYTFSFNAIDNLGSGTVLTCVFHKYFGTGGSPEPDVNVSIGQVTLTDATSQYSLQFWPGNNDGLSIGTNNDDFVQLQVKFPPTSLFDVTLTDFVFIQGDTIIDVFPVTSDAEFISQSVSGYLPTPAPDGSDLYLPIINTKTGFLADTSYVGMIAPTVRFTAPDGWIVCDGSQYLTSGYSDAGVPYSRLWEAVIWDATNKFPRWGTGTDFVSACKLEGSTNRFRLVNNTAGTGTNPADGTTATTFSFSSITVGNATFDAVAGYSGGDYTYVQTYGGSINPQTAAVDAEVYRDGGSYHGAIEPSANFINILSYHLDSSIAASEYFTIALGPSGATTSYNIWFKVDGSGTSPGGTAYEIDVRAVPDYTHADVVACTADAINGYKQFEVTCVAASSITTGSFWNFFSQDGTHYYVWYKKDGAGATPVVANATGILVNIVTSDTAAIVCAKTREAINSYSFAVPDLREMFLRGNSETSVEPLYNGARYYNNSISEDDGFGANRIGTFQWSQSLTYIAGYNSGFDIGNGSDHYDFGSESRPVNMYVNYMIKI